MSSYGYGQKCNACYQGCVGNCCQSKCCFRTPTAPVFSQSQSCYQPQVYCPPPQPQTCFIPGPPGPPGEPGLCINQVFTLDLPRSLFNRSGEFKGYAALTASLEGVDCGRLHNTGYKIINVQILGNTLPGTQGLLGGNYEIAIAAGTTFNFYVNKTTKEIGLTMYAVTAAEFLKVIQAEQPTQNAGAVWRLSDQVSVVRLFYIA